MYTQRQIDLIFLIHKFILLIYEKIEFKTIRKYTLLNVLNGKVLNIEIEWTKINRKRRKYL